MGKLTERRRSGQRFGVLADSGTVEHCSMSSDTLGVTKDFSVYLPAGYDDAASRRYPVLYLFHPAGGTHIAWVNTGQLPQIVDDAIRSGLIAPMIVVVPDASGEDEFRMGRHLGYFTVPGWDYEGFFHNELIPLIDSEYRTLPDRRHRAVAGASMGGEASIAYAQKYPDFYVVACAISGIVGHPEQSQLAKTDAAYARSLIDNDPTKFVERASEATVEKLRTVRWYTDCGDNDFFCEGNVDFFMAMKRRGIPISYRMRSGVHSWYYWITGLAPVLQFVSQNLKA